MKATPFDSTPEFKHYREVMRKFVQVPKAEVDELVRTTKENSPHKRKPKGKNRLKT